MIKDNEAIRTCIPTKLDFFDFRFFLIIPMWAIAKIIEYYI